ncbi:MAG: TonB-dependent receptor [Draconibacterium sp.]
MRNKNGIKKTLGFLMFCLFFVVVSVGAFAQKTVTGVVKDEGGVPLPGVSVVIKGTTVGTATGIDGDFSISNVSNDATLIFSFVGFEPQEILVGDQTTFNVSLEASSIGLEEVVAIGYGTQKKANLTGSVGMATAERLENRPIVSTGQGMQGVIPNLNISFQNGDPTTDANFNIRGFESINGGSPLILVDGVPMDLERLNPQDIASVTVLKDAAAGAVYGARAAFGVILVETKKGKSGKLSFTLSTEQSMSKPIFLIDPVTDPYVFVTEWNKANIRTSGAPSYDDDYVEGTKRWVENPTEENAWGIYNGTLRFYGYNDYKNTLITDFAPQQKYDMTLSGATEKASYYVSFGYLNKEGYLKNKDKNEKYERYNILMKADFKINEWLTLEEKIVFNSQVSDKPHFYNWDVNINTSARKKPIEPLYFPDLPYYLEQGDHDQFARYIGMGFGSVSFLPYLEQGGRNTFTTNDTWFTQGATINPFKGLVVKGDFSYRTYWRESQDVQSKVEVIRTQNLTESNLIDNGFSGDDYILNVIDRSQYYAFNAYAEYTMEQFTDHYIKVMVGFNQEWGLNSRISAQARQLVTPLIPYINATVGPQNTSGFDSSNRPYKNEIALRGVFYRLNYSYKDKYLLEANGRYDGTSRFPTDSRFGFFPSVSLGWRISNESFMDGTKGWLDNLKLRASYGELGNQQLSSYYPYIATMGIGQSNYIMSGSNKTPYVSPAGLVSSSLTWETVVTKNLGLDFTLLNQRLDVSYDIYTRDTKDMLTSVTYPDLLGTSAPDANAADLRTTGWELSFSWRDRIGQDWQYGINLALSDNQAKITKYDNPTGSLNEFYEGQKIGEIWGYVTEGIFQEDSEVANHADQAQLGANWRAGDIMYKDLNGDKKINQGSNTLSDPGDRKIIGNWSPRYSFGINPDVSYKNWTLNVFFQGLFRDYLPENGNWKAFYPYNAGHMEKYYITESWSEDNRDAYFAAPTIGTNTKKNIQPQSRYVQNGAYIRLKNLTLNYNLPQSFIGKMGLSSASVYFAAQNLWEATKMHKPIDPEVEFNNNTGLERNDLTQEYYFQRTFSLGVKVSF